MLTEQDALSLIERALAIRDAERPVPSAVSLSDAAEMLGVSTKTVMRMKLPRNGVGKIPYREVLKALAAR